MFNLSTHPLQFWRCKAVQNTFVCAIPIFSSTLQNLWIFPILKLFFSDTSWAPQVTAPKRFSDLGSRNLRRPRPNFSLKNRLYFGKIQSFSKVLEKIGIAHTNVFCTSLHLQTRSGWVDELNISLTMAKPS